MKMKHLDLSVKLLVTGLIATLAACGGPSVEDTEAALCDDLNSLATALQGMSQITAQSTVDELEAAQQEVADAYESVQASADAVGEARLEELEAAYSNYESTVNSISGGDTLGEAASTITAEAGNVAAARQQLYSGLTCQ